jgi:DUF1680 family protein
MMTYSRRKCIANGWPSTRTIGTLILESDQVAGPPYYAWSNWSRTAMQVWIPYTRI